MKKRLISLLILLTLLPGLCLSETLWAMCRPDSSVNVRMGPKKRSTCIGWIDPCEPVKTTGKKKNGFTQVSVSLEAPTGWIFTGYLVDEKPVWSGERWSVVSRGRLVCRKWINGPVIRRLRNGDEVTVYWYTSEWAITNRGYIQTQYLEVYP